MVQTSYSINMPIAFQGLIADSGFHDITSYLNGDVVGLSFGIGVTQGSTDNTMLLPTSTANHLLGVTVSSFAYNQFSPTSLTGTQGIPLTAAAGVMREGRVYVLPTQDVTPTSPVFWQTVANGSTKVAGSFRADSDGGNAVQITNARFKTTATAGTPAVLEINLP